MYNIINQVRTYSHEIKRCLLLRRKPMTNLDRILKNRDIILPTKVHLVKAMLFPVVMYERESWTIKKAEPQRIHAFELWCWEKTLESPLDCKEIQAVNPKWNHSYIFIERTVAEAETQILWPPDVKSWLLGKDPDAGNNWRQEKEPTEDEMIGWHHWLNGHEFEQAPGVVDGQGSLVYCSPWDRKESDRTERLNWTEELSHHTPTPGVDWKLLHWWREEFQLYMKFIKLKLIQWLELNSHWTETVWKLEVTGEILLSENDLGRCGMCTAFHPRKQRQIL